MTTGTVEPKLPLGKTAAPSPDKGNRTTVEDAKQEPQARAFLDLDAQLQRLQISTPYPITTKLNAELPQCRRLLAKTKPALRRFFKGLENDKYFQYWPLLVDYAQGMVDSLLRNPDAMVLTIRTDHYHDGVISASLKTAAWSVLVGRELRLEPETLYDLCLAALLSRTGYYSVARSMIRNSDSSSQQALELHKWAQKRGMELLSPVLSGNHRVASILANQIDRLDSLGLPDNFRGASLPVLGQLLAMARQFESLVDPAITPRPLADPDAIRELYRLKNRQFDGYLMETFIAAIGLYPTGSMVKLNDKRQATVIGQTENRLKPMVKLVPEISKIWCWFSWAEIDLTESDKHFIVSCLPRK